MKARDVAIGPDGAGHSAAIDAGGQMIVFDDVTAVLIPEPVISLRLAVDGRGTRYAVLPTAVNDYAYVVSDSAVLFTVPHGGRWATAIRGRAIGAEIYAQGVNEDGTHTTITVYDTETRAIARTFRALYGAQGIQAIAGDTAILSSSDPSTHRAVSGIEGWAVTTLPNGWTVMQTEDQPPAAGLRVTAPNGAQWGIQNTPTWNGYTNMPTFLAIARDRVLIAINDPDPGNAAPDPDDVQFIPIGNAPANPAQLIAAPAASSSPAGSSAPAPDPMTAIGIVAIVGAAAFFLVSD